MTNLAAAGRAISAMILNFFCVEEAQSMLDLNAEQELALIKENKLEIDVDSQ